MTSKITAVGRNIIRSLPLSGIEKTSLWAMTKASKHSKYWAYFRCMELALSQNLSERHSVIEFGVANGDRFVKLLHFRDYWLRRMKIDSVVMGMGFDTFEGLPERTQDDVFAPWKKGDYPGDFDLLQGELAARFDAHRLFKGLFSDTIPGAQELLKRYPPVFISIDCDYYSSTVSVLEQILPDVVPHGCVFYFDDVKMNYWSDLTGEMRAIREVNEGVYGDHISLSEYPLEIETGWINHYKRVYRLVRHDE